MLKDKKDEPDKKIPANFEKFVSSTEFRLLLESMLDYCRELFRLENKQSVLEQEAKQRGLPIP
jgi:protein phosphatase 1 regulatory subunit 36